jgi:hypothetical protein
MKELVRRLRRVSAGIGLAYTGLCLWVLSIVIAVVTPFLAAADMPTFARATKNKPSAVGRANPFAPRANSATGIEAIPGPARVVFVGGMIVGLAGWLCDLGGKLLCLAVPPQCRGQSFLKYSAGFAVLFALVQIWFLLGVFGFAPYPPAILTPALILLGLVANMLFINFLRLLAEDFHRDDLVAAARAVLIFVALMFACACGVLLTLACALFFPPLAILGLLGILVWFVLAIAWLARYGSLLSNLHQALCAHGEGLSQNELKFKPAPRDQNHFMDGARIE